MISNACLACPVIDKIPASTEQSMLSLLTSPTSVMSPRDLPATAAPAQNISRVPEDPSRGGTCSSTSERTLDLAWSRRMLSDEVARSPSHWSPSRPAGWNWIGTRSAFIPTSRFAVVRPMNVDRHTTTGELPRWDDIQIPWTTDKLNWDDQYSAERTFDSRSVANYGRVVGPFKDQLPSYGTCHSQESLLRNGAGIGHVCNHALFGCATCSKQESFERNYEEMVQTPKIPLISECGTCHSQEPSTSSDRKAAVSWSQWVPDRQPLEAATADVLTSLSLIHI